MIDDYKMEVSKGEKRRSGIYPSPFYFLEGEKNRTKGGDKK